MTIFVLYETKDLALKTFISFFIDFISFPTLICKLNYRDLDTESKVLYSWNHIASQVQKLYLLHKQRL